MREACLARTKARAATDDRRGRGAVMWRAEGRLRDQRMLGIEQPRYRVDPSHLERLFLVERRQDAREAARQHRLAGARRPAEQQVVPTGGGELERAARAVLSADVREVESVAQARRAVRGNVRLELEVAAQIPRGIGEGADWGRLRAGGSGPAP